MKFFKKNKKTEGDLPPPKGLEERSSLKQSDKEPGQVESPLYPSVDQTNGTVPPGSVEEIPEKVKTTPEKKGFFARFRRQEPEEDRKEIPEEIPFDSVSDEEPLHEEFEWENLGSDDVDTQTDGSASTVDQGETESEHDEVTQKKGFFARFRRQKTDEEADDGGPVEVQTEAAAHEPSDKEPVDQDQSGQAEDSPIEKKAGFFQRLRDRLSKTRKAFISRVDDLLLGKKEIDEELLEELEEILITSDIGVHTAMALIEEVREQVARKALNNPSELKEALHNKILEFLKVPAAKETVTTIPHVVMVVGVNGVGKTTTIGKLAAKLIGEGKKVLLVAGDTFRAAAVEQLEIWSGRVGAEIIRHKGNADPSAVAYDGVQAAISRNVDVVIIDTAGRLHTKVNLMEELKKMRRTVAKLLPEAPHETLLVLDATTGQNAISQAQMFNQATDISGIILTKLDGTAKGGVVVGICHSLGLPIKFIGIGEKVEDLQPFDPDAFMKALF